MVKKSSKAHFGGLFFQSATRMGGGDHENGQIPFPAIVLGCININSRQQNMEEEEGATTAGVSNTGVKNAKPFGSGKLCHKHVTSKCEILQLEGFKPLG